MVDKYISKLNSILFDKISNENLHPQILKLVNDKDLHKESFLFSYFKFSKILTLEQILFSYYYLDVDVKDFVQIYFNENGIAIFPNLGYLKSESIKNEIRSFDISYLLKHIKINKINRHKNIEFVYYSYKNFKFALDLAKFERPDDLFYTLPINPKLSKIINNALTFIKVIDVEQYDIVNKYVSYIINLHHEDMVAFTAIEFNSAIFINFTISEKVDYVIDHIIHESSHVELNHILMDTNEFFNINPFELKFNSPFKDFKRGIYHVLHAVYVLYKLTLFYENCIKTEQYPNNDKESTYGRFYLNLYRFKNGINEINNFSYYTPYGVKLLKQMINYLTNLPKLYTENIDCVDFEGHPIEFLKSHWVKNNKLIRYE